MPISSELETVEIIEPTAVVSIEIGAGFYQKIQQIVGFLIADKTVEDLKDANEQIQSGIITDEWVKQYETLLVLCKEFESEAIKKGLTKTVPASEVSELF